MMEQNDPKYPADSCKSLIQNVSAAGIAAIASRPWAC
jgi:hypothetical protein